MNLGSAFASAVRQHPGKHALYWGDREYTYSELLHQAQWVGRTLLQTFNVRPGDRVGLWLRNCPEFVPGLFGALMADAVVVPINSFLKPDEVNFILADAGIDVVITERELGAHHRALEAARPGLRFLNIEDIAYGTSHSRAQAGPEPVRAEADAAMLIYTSGTTGRPKGAMLSHGNLLANVESCRIVLRTVAGDRIVVLLPMFHSYMITVGILLPFLVGGSIVLVKSLHPVRNAMQEILQRQATILPAIPQFYRSLVNATLPPKLPLRLFISGAAPLPGQLLVDFEAKFGIPLIEGYGLSEASPVVTKNPLDGTHKPGSIGIPVSGVEVTVQDDEGRMLPDREVGEICVRGANVMLGYWNQPAETAKTMRGQWLLTGDVGYRDEDGYFFITDRKKDMLLVNGINVYPREIEEVLHQFPGVKEAAVIGKPDARKGEQPVAFVVATEGLTLSESEILSFARQKLADYKLPRKVIFLDALPRNATGKILKTTLKALPTE